MIKKIWTPFRELEYLSAKDFFDISKSQERLSLIRRNVENGDVYVIKNIISKPLIEEMLISITCKAYPNNTNPRIVEGIENIKYTSTNNKVFTQNTDPTRYTASDVSYYFFPWNNDDLGVFAQFKKIYNQLIFLNGYKTEVIITNTPKDRLVLRLHLIHYPAGSGEISLHIDPTNITTINAGIYFSEYGSDYDNGGFYVVDEKRNEVNLDQKIKKGDLALFSPNLAHGVHRITCSSCNYSSYDPGRYFFHISTAAIYRTRYE